MEIYILRWASASTYRCKRIHGETYECNINVSDDIWKLNIISWPWDIGKLFLHKKHMDALWKPWVIQEYLRTLWWHISLSVWKIVTRLTIFSFFLRFLKKWPSYLFRYIVHMYMNTKVCRRFVAKYLAR